MRYPNIQTLELKRWKKVQKSKAIKCDLARLFIVTWTFPVRSQPFNLEYQARVQFAELVYERGLKKNAGTPLIPALLPFIETSFNIPLSLRATVVPPISTLTDGLISLQLIIDIP